jgi:A118 family predicted phage portal protein
MFDWLKSFFRQVKNGVGNFFSNAPGTTGENTGIVSDAMSKSISFWMDLYTGKAPWLATNKQSLGLPAAIASEIARLVTLEMKVEIKAPPKEDPDGKMIAADKTKSARAEYLEKMFEPLRDSIRKYCEYGCAGGGLMFKPYIDSNGIAIDCVQSTDFLPLSFNSRGKITSCIFVEHKKQGNKYYHRVEKHEFEGKTYVVTNKCFEAFNQSDKGTPASLTDVQEWSKLQPEQRLGELTAPLFSYFCVPLGNTIDPTSPLGVSVYARAVDLIEDADKQYQRFLWEFEGGELAVEASKDVFPSNKKGEPIVPTGKERLYRLNALDDESGQKLIDVFSPALRDESIKNGLNAILQKIEFNSGLAYGTLSDPLVVDKTAEEIKTSKQRSYSTVTDIQKALQAAVDDLVYAMNAYATLYNLAPKGEYEVDYVWDDSIVVDAESERMRDMQEVRAGLMSKWEYRSKWYGEDEDTARLAIDDMNKAVAQETVQKFGTV